jgi:DNA-binding response OmpR family regulator
MFLTFMSEKDQGFGTCARDPFAPIKGYVHILVVEDEQKMAKALQEGLEADEYSVHVAHTGEEGFYLVQAQPFDLVILDVMLPGHDGFEILATLRKHGVKTPVMLLTSRDAIEDRVRGLDSGADDYLVKPFAFPELLARIRVLLRRGKPEVSQRLRLADLELNVTQRVVARAGQQLELTAREFDLLAYLLANHGRVVSREMLARDIWKETARQTPLDNVIDAQIVRLRRKIDGQFEPKLLHTVRGVGFVLREEDES